MACMQGLTLYQIHGAGSYFPQKQLTIGRSHCVLLGYVGSLGWISFGLYYSVIRVIRVIRVITGISTSAAEQLHPYLHMYGGKIG
jgi:hypothetical protein